MLPIGKEAGYEGNVHLIDMQARYFGDAGDDTKFVVKPIPAELLEAAQMARHEMLEAACMMDDTLLETFLEDGISQDDFTRYRRLHEIRRLLGDGRLEETLTWARSDLAQA